VVHLGAQTLIIVHEFLQEYGHFFHVHFYSSNLLGQLIESSKKYQESQLQFIYLE